MPLPWLWQSNEVGQCNAYVLMKCFFRLPDLGLKSYMLQSKANHTLVTLRNYNMQRNGRDQLGTVILTIQSGVDIGKRASQDCKWLLATHSCLVWVVLFFLIELWHTLSAMASLIRLPAIVVNSPGTHKIMNWPTLRIWMSTIVGCLQQSLWLLMFFSAYSSSIDVTIILCIQLQTIFVCT